MLQAKFHYHRTSGSGEEDLLRFLPFGRGSHLLGLVTSTIYIKFLSPSK